MQFTHKLCQNDPYSMPINDIMFILQEWLPYRGPPRKKFGMWAPVDVCGWAEQSAALSTARGD